MYFSNFNNVTYTHDGGMFSITDISPNFVIADSYLSKVSHYRLYTIPDGARPDQVSNLIYGTPKYHWLFFVMNSRLRHGLNGWPLSQYDLDKQINSTYGEYSTISITAEGNSFESIPIVGYEDILLLNSLNGTAKIKSYDSSRCQLNVSVLSNDKEAFVDSIFFTLSFVDNLNSEQEDRRDAWLQILSDRDLVMEDLEFVSAGEGLAWTHQNNAHHSYVYYDDNEGSHYSVINHNLPYRESVTFAEVAIKENDLKSVIKVARPEVVDILSKQYFKGIKG